MMFAKLFLTPNEAMWKERNKLWNIGVSNPKSVQPEAAVEERAKEKGLVFFLKMKLLLKMKLAVPFLTKMPFLSVNLCLINFSAWP